MRTTRRSQVTAPPYALIVFALGLRAPFVLESKSLRLGGVSCRVGERRGCNWCLAVVLANTGRPAFLQFPALAVLTAAGGAAGAGSRSRDCFLANGCARKLSAARWTTAMRERDSRDQLTLSASVHVAVVLYGLWSCNGEVTATASERAEPDFRWQVGDKRKPVSRNKVVFGWPTSRMAVGEEGGGQCTTVLN